MTKFTLTYFDGRGRAEISRWLFAVAEQPFDDVRVSHEEWKKLKPTMPFGQLPVLEVDGLKICQSATIATYLAQQFGLAGESTIEQTRVHMIFDCIIDETRGFRFYGEKDPAKKSEMKKNYEEELKTLFDNLEKCLTDNGNTGYFVGNKLTLADIAFAIYLNRLVDDGIEIHNDSFPKLKQLNENVRSNPKIAEWISKRPVTSF